MYILSLIEKYKTGTMILPIISGFFLVLTLPPFNISLFSWIFLVPLLFFIDNNKSIKRVFQGGFIVGVIYFTKVVIPLFSLNAWWWLDINWIVYENKSLFLFWLLYIAVIYSSLLYGIFAVFYKKIRKYKPFTILMAPLFWGFLELIRAKTLFGFTWGHVGYSLHDNVYLLQIANFSNIYGLGVFVITVNVLFYFAIRTHVDSKQKNNHANYFIYLLLLLLSISVLHGYKTVSSGVQLKNSLSVNIIQPDLKTELIGNDKRELLMSMVGESFSNNPDVIILPENSFPSILLDRTEGVPAGYGLDEEVTELYDAILNLSVKNKKTSLVLGLYSSGGGKKYNSMAIIDDGKVVDLYDKRRLMPFSEEDFRFFTPIESLESGVSKQYMSFKGVPVTYLICSEIVYPELLNAYSKLTINIGNDGVFDSQIVSQQNHIIAKVRAVESGVYILRSMKTGVSSIIDPFGRPIAELNNDETGILSGVIKY